MIRRSLNSWSTRVMKRSNSGSPVNSMRSLSSALQTTIHLNPAEGQLTGLLREAASMKAFSDPDVTIRFAGGWVRDKLLGKQSHDIDIAISSITGHDFAMQFAAFLSKEYPELKTGSITKILANPEKSKHLDTATSRFLNLDLDFVQLRTESYGQADSRTPTSIGVGTLEEDAERRDCTMNALYYNVHSKEVEDPTKHGLTDLFSGIIQTPLAPLRTFLDDPLRVLRCIRFAAQFDFEIEEKTLHEMNSIDVRHALKTKVVKERVGTEVNKMMRGLDPAKALNIMNAKGLYQVVFLDATPDAYPKWFNFGLVVRSIENLRANTPLKRYLDEYRDGRIWLVIALLPYCQRMRPLAKKPGVEEPLACSIIRDCLKLTAADESMIRAVFPPREYAQTVESSMLELAKLVRSLGKDWKLCMLVTFFAKNSPASLNELVALLDRIHDLKLDKAWSAKSFVDGKKIKSLLSESGAHITVMKELVELVVQYRFEDPTISESAALARLRHYLQVRKTELQS